MRSRRTRPGIAALTAIVLAVWMVVVYSRAAVGAAAQAAPQSNSEQAQIEKGRQAVGQTCAACHANILRVIQIHRKSAPEWRDTVYSMIGRGAQILPDEIEPLTAYLASVAGPKPSAPTATAATGGGQSSGTSTPAEAEGKAVLGRLCARCHDAATATRKPAVGDWNGVIDRMVTYGAEVGPADRQKLVDYLNGLTK